MKPARSNTCTGCLVQVSAKAVAISIVESLADNGRTISTRGIAVAGLKKWIPHTNSGREVHIANSITGKVEVLVARIAVGLTITSSSANNDFFVSRSSTTLSMTRSQSAKALSSLTAVIRPRIAAFSSSVSRPFSTCLDRPLPTEATIASAVA